MLVDVRGVDVREGDGVDEGHLCVFLERACGFALANVQRLACVPIVREQHYSTSPDSEVAHSMGVFEGGHKHVTLESQ